MIVFGQKGDRFDETGHTTKVTIIFYKWVHQKDVDNSKGVIGLLLSGLGAVKPGREAGSATALEDEQRGSQLRTRMDVENEFNDRLIMPTQIWCTLTEGKFDLVIQALYINRIEKNEKQRATAPSPII